MHRNNGGKSSLFLIRIRQDLIDAVRRRIEGLEKSGNVTASVARGYPGLIGSIVKWYNR